jgi:maltooligosyltrehalose trehalohydrolase
VPDPQSEETFARSRIHFELGNEGEHAKLREMYRELLAIRREEPALRPGASRITVRRDASARWIAMRLDAPDARSLLALFNLATSERSIPLGSEDDAGWRMRFTTSDTNRNAEGGLVGPSSISLPPLSAALLYEETA